MQEGNKSFGMLKIVQFGWETQTSHCPDFQSIMALPRGMIQHIFDPM